MERRLQTLVMKKKLAKSIHHARVMITQGHIRFVFSHSMYCVITTRLTISVGKQIVTVPSFLVRTDSEAHIELSARSSLAPGGPLGRVRRKKAHAAGASKAGAVDVPAEDA